MRSNIISLFGKPFEKPIETPVPPPPRPRRSFTFWKLLLVVISASAITILAMRFWPLEVRGQRDDPEARYKAGKMFFEPGRRVEAWPEGAALIRSAAEAGLVKAATALGILYARGAGVQPDSAVAAEWFRKAASEGCATAQNELGLMLAKGIGVDKNVEEALRWLTKAADQGSQTARENLLLVRLSLANTIPLLKTLDGEVYHNAEIKKVEADGITVSFAGEKGGICIAKLPVKRLPDDLRTLCRAARPSFFGKTITTRLGQFAQM